MANPLMKVMLNNILAKSESKSFKIKKNVTRESSINLKKEQESLLVNNILRNKLADSQNTSYNNVVNNKVMNKSNRMITLEELRGNATDVTNHKKNSKDTKVEKTLVTLASIGKMKK